MEGHKIDTCKWHMSEELVGSVGKQGGFGFELELHEALVICPFWLFCLHMSHEQLYSYHSLYEQKSIDAFML